MSELIRREDRGALAIVTLNRPARHNAMDDEMSRAFHKALYSVLDDSAATSILLRGEGKSFCSGRDTSVLSHRVVAESDFHFVRRHKDSISGHTLVIDGANWLRRSLVMPEFVPIREQFGKAARERGTASQAVASIRDELP